MSIKQKNTTMRTLLFPCIVLLFLSSCITTTHVHYSDPNYLGSTEFSSYDEIVTTPSAELEQTSDSTTTTVDLESIQLSYTIGSLGIKLASTEVGNAAYSSGSNAEATTLALSLAF